MKARHSLGILLTATVAVSLVGCAGGQDTSSSDASALRLASEVDVTSWNPADVGAGHFLQYMQASYDSLLQLNAKGEVVADLATDWSWDDTRTKLTLELRDDVTFTDGTAFDGEAVAANIDSMKAGSGFASGMLDSVTDVTVVDEHTVTLNLTQPDPGLEGSLAENAGFMASPAAIADGTLATEPVGSGPYVLDLGASTTGSEYRFTRNPDYWASEAYPYDSLSILPLPDNRARLAAVQSGAVDASAAQPDWVSELQSAGLIVDFNPVDWTGLFLNDRDGSVVPALGDVRVRQAINYAFDREGILQSLQRGYGDVTTQIFNPATDAYAPGLEDFYAYNPAKAKQLLADAGYPDGFTLPMPSSDWSAAWDATIQQQLADVGITVEYESIPTTNMLARIPDFGAHWFSWSMFLDPWADVRDLVAPNGAGNWRGTTDPTVEDLVAQIRLAPVEEAGPLYQKLSTYLVEQAWFVPWFTTERPYVHTSNVDVTLLPGNIIPPLSLYAPAS